VSVELKGTRLTVESSMFLMLYEDVPLGPSVSRLIPTVPPLFPSPSRLKGSRWGWALELVASRSIRCAPTGSLSRMAERVGIFEESGWSKYQWAGSDQP
jgi:hypothetical protein